MKTLLIGSDTQGIIHHTKDAFLEQNEEIQGIFVSNPLEIVPEEIPSINTCLGIKNFYQDKDVRDALLTKHIKVTDRPRISTLYALFNGKKFSDWMEVSYSSRLMTGDVGPNVGFITGIGFPVDVNLFEAVPSMEKLQDFLHGIKYQGEVVCGLADNYLLTDINFGHYFGHFGMFSEISKNTTQQLIDFMFGIFSDAELHSSLCISNLVSQQPFPIIGRTKKPTINTPKAADKHIWRVLLQGVLEVILITVHGRDLGEAKFRLSQTLRNMQKYNHDLQFRVDYGQRPKFVLSKEKFEKSKLSYMRTQKNGVPPAVCP